VTALHEPDNEYNSDAVGERSHLTTRDLKKGLQLAENV
jgi:hypothetical protein